MRQIVDDGNQARKFLEVKRLRERLFNESQPEKIITVSGEDDDLQRERVNIKSQDGSVQSNESFSRESGAFIKSKKKPVAIGDFMSGALTQLQQEGLKSSLVRHTQLLQKKDVP